MILPRRIFAARGWLSPLSALRAPFAAKALVDGVVGFDQEGRRVNVLAS
jgi:hypothetical protein